MTLGVFPEEVRFQGQWRPYQARVLGELEAHLDDNRLHVVAAPGSGKTILGLEVMRRLGRPTLVLSPTTAIKEQWVDRFVEWFLPPGAGRPGWISTDVHRPDVVTVVTYQALFTITKADAPSPEESGDDEELNLRELRILQETSLAEEVAVKLTAAGIGTIIVDEAHHLRSEWWRSLVRVIERMDGPSVVALTATPPYDVNPSEWERYQELCGHIDAEITVPELVAVGNLCYHQDYVYLSAPSEAEMEGIRAFRVEAKKVFQNLSADLRLVRAIQQHPWFSDPEGNVEAILSEPELVSAMVVYVNGMGQDVPRTLFEIMGVDPERIPGWDLRWAEVLLTGSLMAHLEEFHHEARYMEDLRSRLQRLGAVERGQVRLASTERIGRTLAASMTKLDSVVQVVELERDSLGNDLRMVILSDYIYEGMLPRSASDPFEPNRIGVVPIFERLRRRRMEGVRLGVLTGSLVIIPAEGEAPLRRMAREMGLEVGDVRVTPLGHDGRYLRVVVAGSGQHSTVQLVTGLFNSGDINVMVGTKSLLGEGWDAPSINALILATFVGSFMLSNQMRGRAIRSLTGHPDKTANIWHLACVEEGEEDAGDDMATMRRRFKAFVGPAFPPDRVLMNGLDRLYVPHAPVSTAGIRDYNEATEMLARDRDSLRGLWMATLEEGTEARMVQQVRPPEAFVQDSLVYHRRIKALLLIDLVLSFLVVTLVVLFTGHWLEFGWGPLSTAIIVIVIVLMLQVVLFGRSLWLAMRYGPVAPVLQQIGMALRDSMLDLDLIRTDPTKVRVETVRIGRNRVGLILKGATYYETMQYLGGLRQILDPIENPRYIIVRISRGLVNRRDHHAVPTVIGAKKAYARNLQYHWRRRVGPCELIFTRTREGRRILLRARQDSLSTRTDRRSEQTSEWR